MIHALLTRILLRPLLFIAAAVILLVPSSQVAAQRVQDAANLPPIELDALEGFRWSDHSLVVAPGQQIIVTNRDVQRHSFAVDEWGIAENLPTLTPVEMSVPADAEIGSSVTFYSAVGDDRAEGLEGVILVVPEEDYRVSDERSVSSAPTVQDRSRIEISDDFSFSPSEVDVSPGAILEIRNTGVIEHHFVVDEWGVNQTIPAGDVAIVQVPDDAEQGGVFRFYCSVPGHEAQGMSGLIRIVDGRASVQTISPDEPDRVMVGKDLRPFVPEASFLGPDWSRLRIGDATTLLKTDEPVEQDIFPQEGLGAIYVGPQGSRVTLIVLPLTERSLPANQVRDAISTVQNSMMSTWNKDRIGSAAYTDAAPPVGCDVAQRASGMVPVLTIPAGATACQLRSAGVAIFVTVEGAVGDEIGVAAADEVIAMLLSRSSPVTTVTGIRHG